MNRVFFFLGGLGSSPKGRIPLHAGPPAPPPPLLPAPPPPHLLPRAPAGLALRPGRPPPPAPPAAPRAPPPPAPPLPPARVAAHGPARRPGRARRGERAQLLDPLRARACLSGLRTGFRDGRDSARPLARASPGRAALLRPLRRRAQSRPVPLEPLVSRDQRLQPGPARRLGGRDPPVRGGVSALTGACPRPARAARRHRPGGAPPGEAPRSGRVRRSPDSGRDDRAVLRDRRARGPDGQPRTDARHHPARAAALTRRPNLPDGGFRPAGVVCFRSGARKTLRPRQSRCLPP